MRPRRVRLASKGRNVERISEGAVDQILRAAEMNVDRIGSRIHPEARAAFSPTPLRRLLGRSRADRYPTEPPYVTVGERAGR
jgi:hypothetical protein